MPKHTLIGIPFHRSLIILMLGSVSPLLNAHPGSKGSAGVSVPTTVGLARFHCQVSLAELEKIGVRANSWNISLAKGTMLDF